MSCFGKEKVTAERNRPANQSVERMAAGGRHSRGRVSPVAAIAHFALGDFERYE